MGIRVGIDLGTTFSAVACIDEHTGMPKIIKNCFGSAITPSVLYFEPDGNILYGEDAKSIQATGDNNAVAFFKRSMGKDTFSVEFYGKTYNATDFSAIFLEKIKKEAESRIGEAIDAAVITVPAYFTHKEREATIQAGKKAGLDVIAIINEPTAAAIAYGLNGKDVEQTVLIYDLGGGTFDVTIARINKDEVNILGSDGNHELGGKDWDDCIARYLASEFQERYGIDLSEDTEMVSSLLVTAENVKKQLTAKDTVSVPITYRNIKANIDITEDLFESISEFLLGTTKELTKSLIASLNLSWDDIDGIILVGGSTRMRMIHKYIERMSGKQPLSGINADEAVALGAAIRANIDSNGNVVPMPGGIMSRPKTSNLYIQGAKAVSDVTSHSLGMISISPDGEKYINSTIIKKNSKIPADNTKSFKFKTRAGNNELEVYVLQGEFERPLDNTIINKYVITQIERVSSPNSIIDLTYRYTSNGVVEVSAVQQENNKKLPIRIDPVPEDMGWTDGSPKDQDGNFGTSGVNIILAIDLSGSMDGEPIEKAQKAMHEFVARLEEGNTKIGIVVFANKVKCVLPLSGDFKDVDNIISKLSAINVGIGNSAEPFTTALTLFKGELLKNESEIRYIIVLTDGEWYHKEQAINAAKECRRSGIEVMALGFGTADYKFLKKIASTDEFASLTSLAELSGSFSKIAQAISEGATGLRVM
ncbi:Hsp70 family protein [Methanosarcina mazei]|uniref:Hsp70 family protein n=1 Tax=Methanosarcina mazei TaxID=2209 RepID=UPI000696B2C3|nr:Hsp70 family protein [Methanosarcina mazei]